METNKQFASDRTCGRSLPNRREAIGICSGCALACAAATPRAVAAWGDPIPAGALKDYTKEEISEKFVQHNFFMTVHKGRLFATIATCPHQGNYLLRNKKDSKRITCTGHDAVFDPSGKPISGPVKQGLVRFGITVDKGGVVRVDPNKQFPQAKWNEKGSYILVKTTATATTVPGEEQASDEDTTALENNQPAVKKISPEKRVGMLREWSDSTGSYTVKAYFKSRTNSIVKLKRADDGRIIDVPLDRLSDKDKQWLKLRTVR